MTELSAPAKSILVVDDAPANLNVIVSLLEGSYRTRVATSGEKALEIARAPTPPDLILLDIVMPGMDGYQVCQSLQADKATREIPVLFLTSKSDPDNEVKGLEMGAVDYISKPVNPAILMARVKTHLTLREAREFLGHQNRLLEQRVEQRTREISALQDASMVALGSLAETRDNETGNHIRRTQHYVKTLAVRLQSHPSFREFLTEAMVEMIYKSAPLHDIGKVGIPDSILLKPGKLTPEEFEIMKTHTTLGRDAILAAERHLEEANDFLQVARDIAYSHHERWDGKGYPAGLKGEQIPIPARLMAVADVYDALISKRVYKAAFSHEQAVEIISEGRATQFDPNVVDAFLESLGEFRALAERFNDIALFPGSGSC